MSHQIDFFKLNILNNFLDKGISFFREGPGSLRTGIEINDSYVAIAQIKNKGTPKKLIKIGVKEITSQDEKKKGEEITNKLRDLIIEQKIDSKKNIILTIPQSNIYIRELLIPVVTENELEKAVKWQAEKYIDFPIEEAICDYQILGKESNIKIPNQFKTTQMSVILIAVKKSVIKSYTEIFKAAGIIPRIIDIPSFALLRAIFNSYSYQNDTNFVGVVDIGINVTTVLIIKEKELCFVRSFNWKWDDSQRESVLTELVKGIDDSFTFKESEALLEGISKVIITGKGAANIPEIDSYLKKELGVEVEKGNPFLNLKISLEDYELHPYQKISPQLLTCIGLGLINDTTPG
ncbi:MAG: pilus assembly protein PilM [bacterium]